MNFQKYWLIIFFLLNTLRANDSMKYFIQGFGYNQFTYFAIGVEYEPYFIETSLELFNQSSRFKNSLFQGTNGCLGSICMYSYKREPSINLSLSYKFFDNLYFKGNLGYGRNFQFEFFNLLKIERNILFGDQINIFLDYPFYKIKFHSNFFSGIGLGYRYNLFKNFYIGLEGNANFYIKPSTVIKFNLPNNYIFNQDANIEKIIITRLQVESLIARDRKQFYPKGFANLRFYIGFNF